MKRLRFVLLGIALICALAIVFAHHSTVYAARLGGGGPHCTSLIKCIGPGIPPVDRQPCPPKKHHPLVRIPAHVTPHRTTLPQGLVPTPTPCSCGKPITITITRQDCNGKTQTVTLSI